MSQAELDAMVREAEELVFGSMHNPAECQGDANVTIDEHDIERLEKLYAESTQGAWMCVDTAPFFGGTPVEVYFHAPLNGMELSDEEFAKQHTAGPICTHVRSKADGEFIAAMRG